MQPQRGTPWSGCQARAVVPRPRARPTPASAPGRASLPLMAPGAFSACALSVLTTHLPVPPRVPAPEAGTRGSPGPRPGAPRGPHADGPPLIPPPARSTLSCWAFRRGRHALPLSSGCAWRRDGRMTAPTPRPPRPQLLSAGLQTTSPDGRQPQALCALRTQEPVGAACRPPAPLRARTALHSPREQPASGALHF